jgi:hypothetical protein
MKKILIGAAAGLLLAGCATGENGKVTTTRNGTPVYGLNDQPETSVSGEGSLMHGVYDARQMPTGQFTGQERTQDFIGQQQPTLPREANPGEMNHSPAPAIGAGTLGQSGIKPGSSSVRGPDLVNGGPMDVQNAATDIYRAPGVGGAPSNESGSGSNVRTNNPTIPNKADGKTP